MTYQLRRIGRPPTVLGAKDMMRLKKDVTRFGRHSQNDYFLDSTEYMCLISRWHAEIHRVEQDGKVKFVLRDNGMNGIYVNDCRVDGNHVLELSDIVTFGHPLGKTIAPGDKAPQPPSEFAFLFERVEEVASSAPRNMSLMSKIFTPPKLTRFIKTADSSLSPITARANSSTHRTPVTPQITPRNSPAQRNSPVPRSNPFDSPTVPRLINSDSVATVVASPHRRGADSHMRPPRSLLADTSENSTFVLKDISNTSSSLPGLSGLVSLDQLIETRASSPQDATSSLTVYSSQHSDGVGDDSVLQRAIQSAHAFTQSDSEQDIFALSQPQHSAEIPSIVIQPEETDTLFADPVRYPITENELLPLSHRLGPKPFKEEVIDDPYCNQNIIGVVYTNNNDIIVKSETVDNSYPPLSAIFDRPHQTTSGSARTSGGHLQSLLKTTHAVVSGDALKVRVKKKPVVRRRDSAASAASSSSASSATSAFNRKRKRKNSKKWTSVKKRALADEDDMKWHYDHDRCDSYDCEQPPGDRVSWVQCDDCDAWYHTECAGTNYDDVKNDVAEFHCGCL